VLLRPIRPDDKRRLEAGFQRLSPESRYRRFMAPVSSLGGEQLRHLTEIDYKTHFAWVAVRQGDPDDGLGVARFIRLKDEPEVAEAAVTVVDDWQGKGLGTLLLALLAGTAYALGVRRFRAYVLEENRPIRELLEQFGANAVYDSPGVLRMDIPLDPAVLADSPASRILKAVATRLLVPIPRRLAPGPDPEA
jgi:GNAT superfamily N-acetyltransferase